MRFFLSELLSEQSPPKRRLKLCLPQRPVPRSPFHLSLTEWVSFRYSKPFNLNRILTAMPTEEI